MNLCRNDNDVYMDHDHEAEVDVLRRLVAESMDISQTGSNAVINWNIYM